MKSRNVHMIVESCVVHDVRVGWCWCHSKADVIFSIQVEASEVSEAT